jgi:hypothetical protein
VVNPVDGAIRTDKHHWLAKRPYNSTVIFVKSDRISHRAHGSAICDALLSHNPRLGGSGSRAPLG